MMNNRWSQLISAGALSGLLFACSTANTYPPAVNPLLAGAPSPGKLNVQPTTKLALIWLEPAGTTAPPEAAQRALAEKIRTQLSASKTFDIAGVATIPAPSGEALNEIRRASAPFGVQQALVVMPNATEVSLPVWLKYGQNGSGVGTRTDSYVSLTLVGVDLATGNRLFSIVTNGEARLLRMDYEDARPFYPRISPGAYSSAFIYPSGSDFPPGEVRAVALEQAVNALIYELSRKTAG